MKTPKFIPYQITFARLKTHEERIEIQFVLDSDPNFFYFPAKDSFGYLKKENEYLKECKILIPQVYCTDAETDAQGKKLVENTFLFY
jgi:hypothetical protein